MVFNPLVSCIIPVYNGEQYLDQGITSLLNQTYNNVEIILVDDCSSDRSWDICTKYAEAYTNVLAFQNETNAGGPLRGRERGIREAKGEWITFMDCDDYVLPAYIEHLVQATHEGVYDIAVTGHARLHDNGNIEKFLWADYSQSTVERLTTFYKHFLTHDFWTDPTDTVGQNLIRASICKQTDFSRYSNLTFAEDTLMALAFLANSQNGINFVDHHDFIWRQRVGSGSHGGFSSRANQPEFYESCLAIFHTPEVYEQISRLLPLVSVVVPVYNVRQYLGECLESIIKQTYQNIEIIIINDGSTDGSQAIIEEYRKKDNRITVHTQNNKGLNMARASGVGRASGEYITFVDSDDIIHSNYTKVLYENILTNDVDISIGGYVRFDKSQKKYSQGQLNPNYAEQVIRDKSEVVNYYLGERHSVPSVFPMSAWGKLYRAEIVKATDWHFSNYRRNEDNFESLQWYSAVNKGIAVISVPLYYYRSNPLSITASSQPCIDPEGQSLNYFEFIKVLYEKTTEYLNDPVYDRAVINQLAQTNSIQARTYITNGWFDTDALNSAVDNWGELIKIYNHQLQLRDDIIRDKELRLRAAEESLSWRLTKILRVAKRLLSRTSR